MKIGLIARCDSTGLGIQSKEFFDHIPCKALVIDFSNMAHGSHREILEPNPDWYQGHEVFKWGNTHKLIGDIPRDVIERFVDGLDILFTMETPYDFNLFDVCRMRGVKTVLQFNYEFLDYPSRLPMPDLLAAPSGWNIDKVPEPKKFLPVPVNTKNFSTKRLEKTFVHIVGRPAAHDRNGTMTFLNALKFVKNDITVHLKGQNPVHVPPLPSNVNIITDFGNKKNYYDNYIGGVLVMPRKYGGLCLVMNEAIASGMPVITNNIAPNHFWLPDEWLVDAMQVGSFQSKKRIDIFEANGIALSSKIDEFCDSGFYNNAVDQAEKIRDNISWDTLLPLYYKTFNDLV